MVTTSRTAEPGGARPVTALALVLLSIATAAAQASGPVSPPARADAPPPKVAGPYPTAAAHGEAQRAEPAPVGPIAQIPEPAPVARTQVPRAYPAPVGEQGIPRNMLAAYRRAEGAVGKACGLRWYHLAAIGRVESGHARGGQATPEGDTAPHILGPVLSGAPGVAAIADTDGGEFDDDPVWDRAVGPMQFIPSTWRKYGADGNKDGKSDPNNIYDAAVAAARYLCSGGLDLTKPDDLGAAIFRYNNSGDYVVAVTTWMTAYSNGVTPVPPAPPVVDPVAEQPAPPPEPDPVPAPTESVEPTPSAETLAEATPSPDASSEPPAGSEPAESPSPSVEPSAEPSAEPAPAGRPAPLRLCAVGVESTPEAPCRARERPTG
ncbi:lytic murein transglycosylase [Actinokineospora auranticolor]|uniref:Membrane-bound lytic murein transglycosylase B n=1 Tax=Actinokineospora auranticolor TaxID=155976 RepID=A0A2S6GHV0_9PSEU|nr:lytic murein transglycosylase [Actinokineospora auranticolor]PPK64799.1 membrane-bound lytic murein transglycosylase B [Actinokineospora auranticolor]